jgi:hypothetical protein
MAERLKENGVKWEIRRKTKILLPEPKVNRQVA